MLQKLISFRFIVFLQIGITFLFLIFMLRLDILPLLYLLAVICLCIFLIFLVLFLQKKSKQISKLISLIVSTILVVACLYLVQGDYTLSLITGRNEEAHYTSVVVLLDSEYGKIKDLDGKKIGILSTSETTDSMDALESIRKKIDVYPIDYETIDTLSYALYQKEVDAILLEDTYRLHVETYYENFENDSRVIYQYARKEEVKLKYTNANVLKDTFTIYVSGIDTYGSVSSVSRSDVNLLITVNPITNQVLITSIPRDYYIPLAKNNHYDKLTHTGLFGVSESVNTLSKFFGIDIDYYARVNFTGLINIVDALGGVSVYSPYTFTTRFGNYRIVEGYNEMDGNKALSFVRERYALPNGDYDRGQNQQRLLTALLKKVLSPSILTSYHDLLNAISGSFETSMESSDITALIQHQINKMPSWDILQYQVKGTGGYDYTYSLPNHRLYVTYPDEETVNHVKDMIHAMENNAIISLPIEE